MGVASTPCAAKAIGNGIVTGSYILLKPLATSLPEVSKAFHSIEVLHPDWAWPEWFSQLFVIGVVGKPVFEATSVVCGTVYDVVYYVCGLPRKVIGACCARTRGVFGACCARARSVFASCGCGWGPPPKNPRRSAKTTCAQYQAANACEILPYPASPMSDWDWGDGYAIVTLTPCGPGTRFEPRKNPVEDQRRCDALNAQRARERRARAALS